MRASARGFSVGLGPGGGRVGGYIGNTLFVLRHAQLERQPPQIRDARQPRRGRVHVRAGKILGRRMMDEPPGGRDCGGERGV